MSAAGNGTGPRILAVGQEPPPMEPAEEPARRPCGARPRRAQPPKGKRGERFALLNAFTDFALVGLSRAEIVVWLVLYRDSRDGIARTAQTDIARRAGINRKTVYRAIRRLERRGLLRVVRRGGLNRGLSSYRVRAPGADGLQGA